MHIAFIAAVLFCAEIASAQSAPWAQVKTDYDPPQLTDAGLTEARRHAIDQFMRKDSGFGDTWTCSPEEMDDFIQGLQFKSIPLSSHHEVIEVEAGAGCARGGQGSNGAMWLIRFDGDKPAYIATPGRGFSGWIYSIEPSESHGYHDIVLGWHMSASQAGLGYFRFDGQAYRQIGSATLDIDNDTDKRTITPK